MKYHTEIFLAIISFMAFIFTVVTALRAPKQERLKFITPALWFFSEVAVELYCIHCPFRGDNPDRYLRHLWGGLNTVIGIISYVSILLAPVRNKQYYDALKTLREGMG